MNPFVERHQEKVATVLGCFDRIVIAGTLPEIAHAEAMARYLSVRGSVCLTPDLDALRGLLPSGYRIYELQAGRVSARVSRREKLSFGIKGL